MKKSILLLIGIIIFLGGGLIKNAYSFPAPLLVVADQTYAGHEYRVVISRGITWDRAKDYTTNGWYLATITSQQEQNFIESLIQTAQYRCQLLQPEPIYGLWLGANCTNNTWHWVTGETWSYTNWGPSQPFGGNYLAISAQSNCQVGCCGNHCCPNVGLYQWYTPRTCNCGCGCNCGCRCNHVCGYIEEKSATVPEPATIILLGSGILGIWQYRKKIYKS